MNPIFLIQKKRANVDNAVTLLQLTPMELG